MYNVLAAPEADTVTLYVQGIRDILTGAHVRGVLFQGQQIVSARIWNGTAGFTTQAQAMDRAALDTFAVEACIKAIVEGVLKQYTISHLIDLGISYQDDGPLRGHAPSEWGDFTVSGYTLRNMIHERAKEVMSNNRDNIRAQLCASPEAIALGAETHARFLNEVTVIRDHFVRDTLVSMGGALRTLVEENVSKEDILSAVGRVVDANRPIAKQEPRDAIEQWFTRAKDSTATYRENLMAKIREDVARGTFHPEEWVWILNAPVSGRYFGQKADGYHAQVAFTDEDVAFIRENCFPTEVDSDTLYFVTKS